MPRNSVRNVAPAKRQAPLGKDLSVIILAAGPGKNMKTFGVRSLIPLAGRQTVIFKQLGVIWQVFPECEVVVVGGYEADRLFAKLPEPVRAVENENYETTNVVRSIAMGLRATASKNILLIYGDVVFNAATLGGIAGSSSAVVVDSKNYIDSDEVGVATESGIVSNFAYGLPTKWGQIAFFVGRELELLRSLSFDRNKSKLCGFEILNEILHKNGSFRAVENQGAKLAEIDQAKDIAKAMMIG